jgi:glycogen operon protein
MKSPHVLQLIMDSLRYWVTEMHVDGFRFDLASSLARQFHEVDRLSAFFDLVHQDPVVSQVKLIAEPWDVGEGGYQVGNFPPLWSEWNGKYRDSIRDYWRGEGRRSASSPPASPDRATSTRTTGAGRRRRSTSSPPTTGSRSTTSSPTTKAQRGQRRRRSDGETHNRSWNHGAEGPPTTSRSPSCAAASAQLPHHAAALPGIPMLLGGDEMGRTQGGNNNGYCQDNEISWYDWQHQTASCLPSRSG